MNLRENNCCQPFEKLFIFDGDLLGEGFDLKTKNVRFWQQSLVSVGTAKIYFSFKFIKFLSGRL